MLITVVTATFNAASTLPDAIEMLRKQTDKNFKWVIIDGASTDGTLEMIQAITDLDVTYISEPDFGIYDALNKAIPMVTTPYYLVIGADDTLYPNAIELYNKKAAETNSDLVIGYTKWGDRYREPTGEYTWLYGIWSIVSTHSLGTLIKTELHSKYGLYSNRFPIAADMHFMTRLIRHHVSYSYLGECIGFHTMTGVSTRDKLGAQTEAFRIRVEDGHWLISEMAFFCLRILREYGTVTRHLPRKK